MDKCENVKDVAILSSSTRGMLMGFDSVKLPELASILADNALNNFEYQGKSLRDWAGLVSSGKLVEVVHGRWENVKETEVYSPDHRCTFTHVAKTCSACNVRIGFIGANFYLYDSYCPNCGAKMDGGGNNGI